MRKQKIKTPLLPLDLICLLQVYTLMLRLGRSNAKCHPHRTTCPAPRTSTPFTRASPLWWTSSETTSHPSKTHQPHQPNLQHRPPFNPIAEIMTTLTTKAHFRTHRVEKYVYCIAHLISSTRLLPCSGLNLLRHRSSFFNIEEFSG